MSTPEIRPSAEGGRGGLSYREMEESVELSHIAHEGEAEQELLTLNMGPHHPATHGVLRLLTTLEGEVVRDIKPIIGYVHTGIEKTAEDKAYWKVIPVVERMDYLSYYFNAMAFCGAVETLIGLDVPPRAQYLRVIHLELNRIASHLIWLATGALDLGAISIFWYGWRDRDRVLDLFEMSCCSGCAASPPSTRRRCSTSASPARCCARPATRGTCARPSRSRATTTSTSRSRSARSATTTTATACGWRRCASR